MKRIKENCPSGGRREFIDAPAQHGIGFNSRAEPKALSRFVSPQASP
jgi:hypothetical protein